MPECLPEMLVAVLSLLYLFGLVAALNVLVTVCATQGVIDWALFLKLFPIL